MKFEVNQNFRECLVLARDPRPGDAIQTLPTICALAKQFDRVNVVMANREIQELAEFPPNVCDGLRDEPRGHRIQPTFVLGVSEAIGFEVGPNMLHPSVALMRFAGLECDDIPKRPRIKVAPIEVAPYDVVIAPWASDTWRRSLKRDDVRRLILALGPGNFAVIGSETNDRLEKGTNAAIAYGLDFDLVAGVMATAKVVVTVASFPSRLAFAAGVKKHILLLTDAMPHQFESHPGATIVPIDLQDFKVEPIVSAIKEALVA